VATRIYKRQLQCHAEAEDGEAYFDGGKYGSGVAANINGPIVLDDQFDCRALSSCRSGLQLLFPGRAAMLSP
jgi:hypothetical protein